MEKITIFALHLAYGGVEKAICNMANMFCDEYEVELMTTYQMPNSPAYALDKRIQVTYMLKQIPNKEEFRQAVTSHNPFKILSEGLKSVKILYDKKHCVINSIKKITHGIIITTRNEDNILLSKYGNKSVYKIAQLHHDHLFNEAMVNDFKHQYANIDIFALLTDQLVSEVSGMMSDSNHFTKCICIPNFIDFPSLTTNVNEKDNILVSVGRFHKVKGFDRLLQCFAKIHLQYPNWKLYLVGDGEEDKKLRKIVKDYKLEDSVVFCGEQNAKQIAELNQKASIYVMSSYSEGLPFVLLEAASASLPIVAFDVRVGPRAVIEDGVNGFLIKDGDCESFVEKVCNLIEQKELRLRMGKNSYMLGKKFERSNVQKCWLETLHKGANINE